jgi:hypothetical protein
MACVRCLDPQPEGLGQLRQQEKMEVDGMPKPLIGGRQPLGFWLPLRPEDLAMGVCGNLCVVGDPIQCLFQFQT